MGIFKSFKKILKKAAPVIGGTIGFALGGPLGSAAIGSALGAGIGSLAAGYDTDDALKAALLGGIGGYATSGSFFTPKAAALPTQYGSGAMATGELADIAVKSADTPSFFNKAIDFAKENSYITSAGIGTLAALGAEEPEQQKFKRRPDPVGESMLGIGIIGDKSYDLDDDEERKKYFEDLREKQGIMPRDREVGIDPIFSASGGEVNGPGTGTSDSVPARLSDGEFVLTAKAVRGAGGGDRDIGAARMYEMMSELERVA
jgi:hypothetical protein